MHQLLQTLHQKLASLGQGPEDLVGADKPISYRTKPPASIHRELLGVCSDPYTLAQQLTHVELVSGAPGNGPIRNSKQCPKHVLPDLSMAQGSKAQGPLQKTLGQSLSVPEPGTGGLEMPAQGSRLRTVQTLLLMPCAM